HFAFISFITHQRLTMIKTKKNSSATTITPAPATEKKKKSDTTSTTTTTTTATTAATKVAITKKPAAAKVASKTTTTSSKQTTNKQVNNNNNKGQQQQQQTKRKRKNEEEEVDSSDENDDSDQDQDSSSSSDSDDESDFDEISVQFDITKVESNDYHSIKNMMIKLVPWTVETKFNAGAITDLILDQCKRVDFGRAIRVENNDDPYGFVSVLNYATNKQHDAVQGYADYIAAKTKQPETQHIDAKLLPKHKQMSAVVADLLAGKMGKLGLFFNERFLNIPYQLVHPLHQYVQWDIELLTKKQKHDNAGSSKSKKESEDAAAAAQLAEGEEYYFKIEDKYLRELASAWCTFNIPYDYGPGARWTLEGHMHRKGLIMVVPQSNIQTFLETIKTELQ
ncbi:hypothetical protein SAMD00019534_104640, partial [Acytostelium subglobosum LB1]|uniref:hypothetical protein n=1 Tax=Acytostelium subglobosum LB1 TaxID=1410327 RepID=UPI000644B788